MHARFSKIQVSKQNKFDSKSKFFMNYLICRDALEEHHTNLDDLEVRLEKVGYLLKKNAAYIYTFVNTLCASDVEEL